jgi:uncharacterized protein (TIGR04255 family)
LLVLAEPQRERLARSPLKLVVCQIRFPEILAVTETRVGLAVQERLGGPVAWRLESVKPPVIAFSASIGGAPAAQTAELTGSGWRLTSSDSSWTVTLMPTSVALETTKYESWEGFLAQLTALLNATDGIIQPEAEERLGLRYINRVEDPRVTSPVDWRQWIRSEVLGLLNHANLGPGTTAAQQQVVVEAGDGVNATIRQGFARDDDLGSFPYVLDIDAYRDEIRRFDQADIRAAAVRLNRLTLGLFQSMITGDLYDYFREGVS